MLREARRPKVLVAEDDRAILELIATRLTIAGYDVLEAHDGWEALRAVQMYAPAGLILDINMPRLDGFGVLRSLRELRPAAQPPVLVLTALNAPDHVREALRLGARDYLVKPFDDAQLLARTARLLRQRAA